ncbi:MAG TPA: exodeoxyribonuclease VII small subunit [Candidatus Saccharimonadales bacterium]|nr:exodeoxyribonuclease VII small subunit [Candidatus Saccharimonadales bacterium]
MTTKKSADYQTLSDELDVVVAALQDPDVQVDQAVILYEKGLDLIAQMETYLTQAENRIEKLKLQATAPKD